MRSGKGHQMITPVTTLDQRYSDTKADAVGWEATLSVLKAAGLS